MSLPNPNMDFSAFDTLPATELDDLVENIEALADGSGMDSTAVLIQSNPYKFRAYRAASFNLTNGSFGKVTCDTEVFDTNNNFASGTYTAPVSGFYQVSGRVSHANAGDYRALTAIYKNGTAYARGSDVTAPFAGSEVSTLVQLTAGDTLDLYNFTTTGALAADVSSSDCCYFSAHLVSRT